ncbi:ArsR family transcriptional regulator [Streptomyces sp. CB00455]|uniref:ArsR/SmtB family transcription factor n=1 Tax=Streptomyces sp. CB00455 TaxID=1703927 RepID=UPI0009405970|nr:helix-turn-helix transcriptional regulator [Streptomyces sp. CB00455]OKK16190.1 ArsR family transcriptional regulator [Streptomyces sp. CB00455]
MSDQAPPTGHRPAPVHTHPDNVPLLSALSALADPVRIQLVRDLAGHADWTLSCSDFDVPVGRAAKSHHFGVLRDAGLVEQRDQGTKRFNRLRREEFDARFPGLLDLTLRTDDTARTATNPVLNPSGTALS